MHVRMSSQSSDLGVVAYGRHAHFNSRTVFPIAYVTFTFPLPFGPPCPSLGLQLKRTGKDFHSPRYRFAGRRKEGAKLK